MQVWPHWTNLQLPLETETSIIGIGNVGIGVVNERVKGLIIGDRHLAQEHLTERATFDTPHERTFIHGQATHPLLLAKRRIDLPDMSAKSVLPLAHPAAGPLHLDANNRG